MKRIIMTITISLLAIFYTGCEELTKSFSGCMLEDAPNFKADAYLACTTDCVDDKTGSNCCCEEIVYGCTDTSSPYFSSEANAPCKDASCGGTENCCCITSVSGCTDPSANNYDPLATVDDGSCTY